MAKEEQHGKTPEELIDRVWELGERIQFCLLGTWDGEEQWLRPLSAIVRRSEHAIYFLVDRNGTKNEQIERFPNVAIGFADPKGGDYVTINGRATLTDDRAKIAELWSPFMKAWWDSASDHGIRLLTVRPDHAELWEGPNKLVAAAIMLTAAVTGAKPPVGDHGRTRM